MLDLLIWMVFTLGALLVIATPGSARADADRDACVIQRYLDTTHFSRPEVRAQLDAMTPTQRWKVLAEITRTIQDHRLDRVYLFERQRVRQGVPDVCGVGRE
jgi:hypothetical protein